MELIDNLLNRITMYRLVFYYLLALLVSACLLSAFGYMPYSALNIAASAVFLVAVSYFVNSIFATTFDTQTNVESVYISSMILALVITPAKIPHVYIFLFWAATLTMASKYILAISKKHVFNPVAIALVITAFVVNQSASWWVGSAVMLPVVIIGGILIVKKIQRTDMVFSFIFTTLVVTLALGAFFGQNIQTLAQQALVDSCLFFFAFIMLTEPLTTPPTKNRQIIYGGIVGLLFSPLVHFGSLYFTPELALVTGNIYSYLASPKQKLMLRLKQKIRLAPGIYDFVFNADKKINFAPGQYLEWTLGHQKPDSRGNRRYFTLASSPTESEIIMGVKFYTPPSSFKKSLLELNPGQTLLAGQLAGDFTMPKDTNQKLVFIAGGIGVTPFRSMVKYMIDKNERRDVVIFYANRTADEIVYKDIFDQATQRLGIKTVYTISSSQPAPAGWNGKVGYIDEQIIKTEVPDFNERMFYISGPRSMTTSFEQTLAAMGLPKSHIKVDFFPGFA